MNDVLQFAADREPMRDRLDVRQVVCEVIESFAPQLTARRIGSEIDVAPGIRWVADREMVRQALVLLVGNAIDAMPDGGELDVTCWNGASGLELEVADSGPSLDEATRRAHRGMGLAIAQGITQAHGGNLTAANCPQGGAAFTLVFPRRAVEAAA